LRPSARRPLGFFEGKQVKTKPGRATRRGIADPRPQTSPLKDFLTMMNTVSAHDQHLAKSLRAWSGLLSLWRLCGNTACRRARCCRGHAAACFPRNFPLLPPGVRDWFIGLLAAKQCDVPFDEAIARLDTMPYGQAFREWNEAETAERG
jgi:hypothetical protein